MKNAFRKLKIQFPLTALFAGILAATAFLAATPGQASAACAALPSAKGTVTMTINAPSAGPYRVWARMLAPSANANGFYLQIADANACQVTMGKASIPVNTWTWVDYQSGTTSNKVNVTLTAGNHTVVLAGLDDTVEVDKILLLSDTSCTPTGDGSNCTAAAATPSPASGGGTGGGATPSATPTPIFVSSSGTPATVKNTISIPIPAGAKNTECFVDGKKADCASIDTTKLSDGLHTVQIKGTGADGKPIDKKTTINVKNKLTPQEQLVAGLQKYKFPLIIIIVLLIALPVGFLVAKRMGLLSRFFPVHSNLGASGPGPDSTAPTGPTVYPGNDRTL